MRVTILMIIILLVGFSSPNAIEVSGDVWGEWTSADNPYIVVGDLWVPQDSTLIIGEGCYLEFQDNYRLYVDTSATFQVLGTESDSVIFTPIDTVDGWGGIRLLMSNENIIIRYALLEYGRNFLPSGEGGAIYLSDSELLVEHCEFRFNYSDMGASVYSNNSRLQVLESYIHNNVAFIGAGIFCYSFGSTLPTTISQNIISYNHASNGGGFSAMGLDSIVFDHNVVFNNFAAMGGGVEMVYCDPDIYITNNSIVNNGGYFGSGIHLCDGSDAIIINTIVWNNDIYLQDFSAPEISYSNIDGSWVGEGNINVAPMFVDTVNGDYSLMVGSPCIDSGDPNPPHDPDGSRSDMGAFYYPQVNNCAYIVGDVNLDNNFNGLDIVYGVAYFKNTGPPPPYQCLCAYGSLWNASGDVNGMCDYNGLDITYGVSYFKGIGPEPVPCPDCPPVE